MASSGEQAPPTHSNDMVLTDIAMETAVDSTSKNRASVQLELEKKLKSRVDRDHLVQMNILPAVSTAPVLIAQTNKLLRQKTADSLQQKLRERATRNELCQRNILPNSKLMLDPSLSATQKQLQKKKIADNLNVKISNRPGILELVEGNILEPHLSKALESYLHNSDFLENPLLDHPSISTTPSPTSSLILTFQSNDGTRYDTKFSDSTSPVLSPADAYTNEQRSPAMLFSPGEDVPTPPPPPPLIASKLKPFNNHHPCKAPSPSQARKRHHKPKYRKLRYHEYIPPSKSGAKGGKTNSITKPPLDDTPYSLLLQQQQLFLQLQVLQQQYPNGVLIQKLPELLKNLPASLTEKAQALLKPKLAGMENTRPVMKTHEIPEDIKVRSPLGGSMTVRLDELKVNSLKTACKEQNLIVSGKKVELIERLLEHNNGILPVNVLSDNGNKERRQSYIGHSLSLDSHKSNSNSPQSPDQDTLFQFPIKSNGQPMDTSIGSPIVTGLVGQLQKCDFKQQVDKMIEKKKIDYLSANGPKIVAPKPDLNKLLTMNHIHCDKTSSSFKLSKSLPTSPKQLSPAGSTDNILYELMEQSPRPNQPPPPTIHLPHNKSPDMFHSPQLTQTNTAGQYTTNSHNRRSGRISLPNPPPYPGVGSNFLSNDLTGSSHFNGYHHSTHSHLLGPRSVSLSGPSNNVISETNNGFGESLSAFNNNDDSIGLSEIMEMETDFNDLFKLLEKEEHTITGLAQTHQSLSFDQTTQGIQLPHQDSIQSDSVMFGVPMNQSLKGSNSLEFLPTLDNNQETKPTMNGGHNYGELGMLNLDNSLLGSSPHLQGYLPDSQTMTHQNPYDYFQNGLIDDIGFKPSSSNLEDFSNSLESHHQLMEASQFGGIGGGGLFGSSDSPFLDLNLTS